MQKILLTGLLFATATSTGMASELCMPLRDTGLYSDAALTAEVRPVFQFDGVQFIPESRTGMAMAGAAYDILMQPLLEEQSFIRADDWTCESLAETPQPASAASYDASPDACRQEFSDTRITLDDTTIGFFESSCDILGQKADAAGAIVTSLNCYGEGSEWPAEAKITHLPDGGLELVIDGYSQTYVACEAQP